MFNDYPVSFPTAYLWPASDAATWLGRSRLIKHCWPVMLPSTPGCIRSSPHPNFPLSHPSWINDRQPFTTLSPRVRSLNPVSSGHLKAFLMGVWRRTCWVAPVSPFCPDPGLSLRCPRHHQIPLYVLSNTSHVPRSVPRAALLWIC